MSSIFTPAGTNAQQNQENQQASISGPAAAAFNALAPLLQQQTSEASSYEPMRQGDINQALMLMSPGNNGAREQEYNNQVQSNTAANAKQQNFQAQAQGLGSGYQSGQDQADDNEATSAENAFDANQDSVANEQQQAAAQLGEIAQAQSIPSLQNASGLASLVYSRPTVQVQPGFGQQLGNIAGQFLGGDGFGNLMQKPDNDDGD